MMMMMMSGNVCLYLWAAKSRKSVHFNEEVEVQIVESPAVEVFEVNEVGFKWRALLNAFICIKSLY